MSIVRIASAGAWHSHAKDFANRIESIPIPNSRLEAVYDADPATAKAWAEEKGVRCFTDYDALIKDPDIDGIIVTAPTTLHADYLIRALKAGKNVYVEKALCATAAEAKAIQAAVHEAEAKFGTRFVMSDPVQKGAVLYAKQLMEQGRFGRVLSVRSRNGHDLIYKNPDEVTQYVNKAEAGGGVMMDMGHHSVHAVHFLLGKPVSAMGMFNHVSPVSQTGGGEDHFAAMFQYADGTIGFAEGGLITPRFETGLEIVGTEGYLISTAKGGIRCWFDDGSGYTVDPADVPTGWESPQMHWIRCIHEGIPCDKYGIDEAVELIEMIEAAYSSSAAAV